MGRKGGGQVEGEVNGDGGGRGVGWFMHKHFAKQSPSDEPSRL